MKALIAKTSTLVLAAALAMSVAQAAVVDFQRTVVVSPVGTPQQNGAALLAALDGIADADQTNPYLLKIEPGRYDLGAAPLTMKEYVDIEGSGELVTTITASNQSGPANGTVIGASNAELRFLTIENTGGSGFAKGLYSDGAAPQLDHVTIRAIDDTGGAHRVHAMEIANATFLRAFNSNIVARGGANSIAIALAIRNVLGTYVTDTNMAATEGAQAYGLTSSGLGTTLERVRITGGTAAVLGSKPDSRLRTLNISHAKLTTTRVSQPALNNNAGLRVRLAFCEIDLQPGGTIHSGTAPEEQKFCFARGSLLQKSPLSNPFGG